MTILKISMLILLALDVKVGTLDGESISGPLSQLNQESAVVGQEGQQRQIPLSDVIQIEWPTAESPVQQAQSILLHDNSRITCQQISSTARTLRAESSWLGPVSMDAGSVRAVMLQPLDPDWMGQWDAFLERTDEQDLLIVLKRDKSGLDFLTGVVGAIEEEKISFLLGGDQIPVPRDRVFGVVYTRKKAAALKGTTKIEGAGQIQATDVTLNGTALEFKASWGQQFVVPTSSVHRIDFSAGRIHYLSDLQPVTEQYFGLDPELSNFEKMFENDIATRTDSLLMWRASVDRFPNGPDGPLPLTLRGKRYAKGLCIFPRARIEYAVDGNYKSFLTLAGIDDEVAFNANPPNTVTLRVAGDGTELLNQTITASNDPVAVNLDLTGVRTLTIEVDFGDDSSVCDYLDLANARLIVNTSN